MRTSVSSGTSAAQLACRWTRGIVRICWSPPRFSYQTLATWAQHPWISTLPALGIVRAAPLHGEGVRAPEGRKLCDTRRLPGEGQCRRLPGRSDLDVDASAELSARRVSLSGFRLRHQYRTSIPSPPRAGARPSIKVNERDVFLGKNLAFMDFGGGALPEIVEIISIFKLKTQPTTSRAVALLV